MLHIRSIKLNASLVHIGAIVYLLMKITATFKPTFKQEIVASLYTIDYMEYKIGEALHRI